jgi:hypothetical protein
MKKPRLRSLILCDEVRTENTGKKLLIGVYSRDVNLGTIPSAVSFSLFFEVELYDVPSSFEIEIGGLAAPQPSRATFSVPAGFTTAHLVAPVNAVIEQATTMTARWRAGKGLWSEKYEWDVRFSPDARPLDEATVAALRSAGLSFIHATGNN